MTNLGNTPYPIAHSIIKRKRRKRIAAWGGAAGLTGLFGTRRGKKLIGSGIARLHNYSPGTAKAIGGGLSTLYKTARKGRRAIGSFLQPHAASLFQKSFNRFPTQTTKVLGGVSRAGSWLTKAKSWMKMIPRF